MRDVKPVSLYLLAVIVSASSARGADNDHEAASKLVHLADACLAGNDLNAAIESYRRITIEYPKSKSYGIAQFNLGRLLEKQGKYANAVVEYSRLFSSGVNDEELGSHVMESVRNYRHNAATRISYCYEELDDIERALEFARLAQDKYPSRSWCGTCQAQSEAANASRQAILLDKLGRIQECVDFVEDRLFSVQMDVSVIKRLVEIHQQRRQLDQLTAKIESKRKANIERLVAHQKHHGEPVNTSHYSGCEGAMDEVRKYVEIVRQAENRNSKALWTTLRRTDFKSATESIIEASDSPSANWKQFAVVEQMVKLGPVAKPELLDAIKSRSIWQGWALIILSKQNAPEGRLLLKREFQRAGAKTGMFLLGKIEADSKFSEDDIRLFWRADYFLALLIYGDEEGRAIVDKYRNHIDPDLSQPAGQALDAYLLMTEKGRK